MKLIYWIAVKPLLVRENQSGCAEHITGQLESWNVELENKYQVCNMRPSLQKFNALELLKYVNIYKNKALCCNHT